MKKKLNFDDLLNKLMYVHLLLVITKHILSFLISSQYCQQY